MTGIERPADSRHYHGKELGVRDPDYIRTLLPALEAISRLYFRARVHGVERIPQQDPVIFVGNHSGGLATPDSVLAAHAFWTAFGVERPIYALTQRQAFWFPVLNRRLMRLGCLAATARMAQCVLQSGASLLIYPGAGHEAFRPFARRHDIDLNGNSAYVRLALRFGAPIVPVVSLGGHDSLVVLNDGRALVERLHLDRLGLERLPLIYSWPLGLTLGTHSNLPFPVRIDVDFGRPITFRGFDATAARDPGTIAFCHDHVEQVMQSTLDRMVALRKAEKQERRRENV